MDNQFQIFEPRFNMPDLEDEFHNFFHKYGLDPLFTNEHRAGTITVAWIDAKSVVNPGGSYHETLKEFADIILMANDNKSYEETLFKILYDSRTFAQMMKKIRSIMKYIGSINNNHMWNMWNIVWYDRRVSFNL